MPPEAIAPVVEGEAPIIGSEQIPALISADPPAAPPQFTMEQVTPEAFKNEAWVKDVHDISTLFKMVGDQKAALSRRAVPTADSSQEEWAAFNKSIGVPETADAYNLTVEGKEYTDADKAFHEALKPVLLESEMTPRQIEKLVPGFNKVIESISETQAAADDAAFTALGTQHFGDKQAEVFAETNRYLAQYLPEAAKPLMASLDNNALIALSFLAQGMTKEFVTGDSLPTPSNAAASGGETIEQLRGRAQEIMRQDGGAWSKQGHPKNAELRAKTDAIYAKIDKMRAG